MLKETDALSGVAVTLVCPVHFAAFKWLLKASGKKRAEMTGGIFTACINSTDPLIPLLGPSGGPSASAT